ncbi:acetyl-CoA synthetase-like protein [Aulographum hederae CBS 113979]|uniref:Acetyl-CoA synthetase-like protein n=1 Tax=Aulographum hederae CBS 113979 TaxID=1176131 RepID=A0A6G1H190_9PEZI|nr:acetyl-CoA synthetase-like protein [Aulographum hederae CBS 113979]
MAEDNPELQAKLHELDTELEEGEITQKGYDKRRTVLLSQYLEGPQADQFQRTLRLHSVDGGSPSPSDGSRAASFAALGGSPHGSQASMRNRNSISPLPSIRQGSGDYSSGSSAIHPASQVGRFQERQLGVRNSVQRQSSYGNALRPVTPDSRAGTMMSNFAFNPATQNYPDQGNTGLNPAIGSPGANSRLSTMVDQGYFSDFAGGQMEDSYGGPNRYSSADAFSPSAAVPPPMLSAQDLPSASVVECMLPLEPRDVPFDAFDPHNGNVPMSKFENIGAVLRHRGATNSRAPACWVLDTKGKETASITWEKLTSRAEKVAQVIRDKSNLYRGDRVALVYRDSEIIDFAVALMGCFLAGVVAVPMNNLEDYQKLSLLLTTTQAHLALTTDNNLKAFHRDISAQRLKWPTGVEWWKTNEFGSHHHKKKDDASLPAPDLAYIEFSRAPTGDLRGVVLSHRTIMHQMACLQAILSTVPTRENVDTFNPSLRDKNGSLVARPNRSSEVILSYLDPRQGVGMILGVLLGVYGGHTTVWMESKTVETPGLYAHIISKYKTTVMVADYPGLKRAAYNYQQDPMATRNFKKNIEPNFASLKICLIDTLTVDSEFHEILADRWLRPMRNPRARQLVAPMLCLPEHGGMIVSVRDWLGGEERMGCPLNTEEPDEEEEEEEKPDAPENGYTSLIGGNAAKKHHKKQGRTDLMEVLLDKEALKTNEVIVLATGEEASKRSQEPNTLRVGAFGYPIPDATLALVDPETNLLCQPYTVGEIWVDSPSLSGGFWALPKHTETIFHARPYRFIEGNPTPVLVEPEFLRTGLLGCIIQGKMFVLGLYEDRIRQRVEWVEDGMQEAEHRYFFVQHLVLSILKAVPKIYDCSAFDSHVNGEYLPIILLETQAASTAPTTTGGPPRQLDIPFLDTLSERIMEILYQEHHLRVFCVMITAPNTLPRINKNGRREIGNMLCRREFDNGSLACVHVKFGVERAVQNLPVGDDPAGGIWSPIAAQGRQELLMLNDKQYSGVDHREVVIDDRTSTPLNQFSNIHDLLQWRVSRQAEELCYCTIDGRGKEGKGVNWKKFDLKVAAVAIYLKNKVKLQTGDHVVLMYTHSEEFVFAVHACIVLGLIAIPMAPLDQNRLNEDAPALLHMIADFKIKALLVNNEVNDLLKQKPVSQHLKQSALILRINMPTTYNTTKPSKQTHGCRDLGLTIRPAWVQTGHPVLIWIYWTPDQRRQAIQLGHDTIIALCKIQKETCQMLSTRPVLGCVRSTIGLGFIHTCLMGIFLASPTYLVSPVDFAQNPNILFQTLSRYKIKDTYATSQMLDHAMASAAGKMSGLHELKNLMISTDSRPRVDVYQKVRVHFAQAGLDRTAINTIYSHVLNPMVASRSYMCIEPIELWLDMNYLRRGLVMPVDPESSPGALLVQDSGMVPVSTQISIVNPETNQLCYVGEFGEIWVQSEGNAQSFYGTKDAFDFERFNGRTVDGDPNVKYMRTGDLGFLHNVSRPIGPNGSQVDMQILFVLGNIGETFDVNGLSHFPMDIELSVERCHRNIVPGGCAVFQAGGLVVVLVEIFRRNFLASLVPVIVNAILNGHHLVVDIVAFVGKGDFPRSRLGEKQRGKILASWVTRKMRTIAQFKIRDPDGPIVEVNETGSVNGSGKGKNGAGSMGFSRGPESMGSTTLAMQNTPSMGHGHFAASTMSTNSETLAELPDGKYPESIPELPAHPFDEGTDGDHTPTEERLQAQTMAPAQQSSGMGYSPIDARGPFASGSDSNHTPRKSYEGQRLAQTQSRQSHSQSTYSYGDGEEVPAPLRTSSLVESYGSPERSHSQPQPQYQQQQQEYLSGSQVNALPAQLQPGKHYAQAAYDGSGWGDGYADVEEFDEGEPHRWAGGGGGGGLRIANRASVSTQGDAEEWPREAIMYGDLREGPGGF